MNKAKLKTYKELVPILLGIEAPEWKRTFLCNGDAAFLPGRVFFGSDQAAILCAAHDAEPVANYKGMAFLDSRYLARNFADHPEIVKGIGKARDLIMKAYWSGETL
jgi:hypothetical protein